MKAVWDGLGEHIGEAGLSRGMLYNWNATTKAFDTGVPFNGLTAVNESPTGAESTPFYADNIKYLEIMSAEDYAGSIEAFAYPDEFKRCNGEAELVTGVAGITVGQQTREPFGFAYRVEKINDTEGMNYGYVLHLVYNARASVSEAAHTTINDSPELVPLSWDFTTTPMAVADGFTPAAHLAIDTTVMAPETLTQLAALEVILYGKDPTTPDGTDGVDPRLPLPAELITLFTAV